MSRKYAFFGAAPDTTNLGVSALFRSVLEGVGDGIPDSQLLVFDNGLGVRKDVAELTSGVSYEFCRIGARGGGRYYALENLATMSAVSLLGPVVGGMHPRIRALDRCNAVLDVSGGDSFSDIYGSRRFWAIVRPKLIAQRRGIPLILLPQTYGPFEGRTPRRVARRAILGAEMAWARDPYSYAALQELLRGDFDADLHKQGVDMAFALEPRDPGTALSQELTDWLCRDRSSALVGLNISGLIGLDPVRARNHFQLQANYVEALRRFLEEVIDSLDARVVLIPHVMSRPGSYESDQEACHRVLHALPSHFRSRLIVAPTSLDESEVKWLIGQTDWFCGTRMHSTIAAMSSGVPTAAIAYSDKTRGVFASCGLEHEVIDSRRRNTESVVKGLLESFERRAQTKAMLSASLPEVNARARSQLREIVELLERCR